MQLHDKYIAGNESDPVRCLFTSEHHILSSLLYLVEHPNWNIPYQIISTGAQDEGPIRIPLSRDQLEQVVKNLQAVLDGNPNPVCLTCATSGNPGKLAMRSMNGGNQNIPNMMDCPHCT